ncbi:uncharacterized protein LTR77_002240 [Saxophila tyrrhenica]|uniref:Uncharacterized protein n=1 Tax=Saxophila tyrrhenica TaxID=1690608 RepID=A0AAV9PIY5_9PEZI|nr:hypothetical protein LTR77_002240 [Saxophila tyrrhenica]
MTLTWLKNWQPFQIDALGLVTLLGAEQVNKALGCFIAHPVSDYLPLLAAFVVAGDSFNEPIPGFQLYNVTDGIVAYDISPWFSRWLFMQDLTWNSTYLSVHFSRTRRLRWPTICSLACGLVVNGTLIAVAAVMGDWWGLANASALAISVIVRRYLLEERAKGLRQNWYKENHETWANVDVKCLVLTPAGQAVTIYAPRGIITEVILTEPKVKRKTRYRTVRIVGWIGFFCHIVALGMASLVNQMISVFVLIVSTWSAIYAIGTDHSVVAGKLRIERHDGDTDMESRSRVYRRLDLTAEEVESLLGWSLMPPRLKQDWWRRYYGLKDTDRQRFKQWRTSVAGVVKA